MRKIFIAGDSTAAIKEKTAYPETGWGEAFRFMLSTTVDLRDYAVNGRSTKSFITDGLLEKIDNEIEPGDFLLIQFGHNDEKIEDPNRYADPEREYPDNLRKYIDVARKHQATPILLTSVSRRLFEDGELIIDNIGVYPEVMRKVAKEENVCLIDINKVMERKLIELGDEASKELYLQIAPNTHENYPNGVADNTHFSAFGAYTVASEIAKLLEKTSMKELIRINN